VTGGWLTAAREALVACAAAGAVNVLVTASHLVPALVGRPRLTADLPVLCT
jgi:hypothetical protein